MAEKKKRTTVKKVKYEVVNYFELWAMVNL